MNWISIKDEIVSSLRNKDLNRCGIYEHVSVVDGIVKKRLCKKLSNETFKSESYMPIVMLLGNETGNISFFSIKSLLDS